MAKSNRFHFIGIGGAGMSGIAKVLLEMGFEVTGSDLKESRYTRSLVELGANVAIGHDPANVEGADVAVISSAIPEYNTELKAAKEQGLLVLSRAQMLDLVCAQKSEVVAIAGTHGKTTTTSMVASILEKAGLGPTFLIGGELNDIGSNAKYGAGEACVVEADESDGSLVCLHPDIAVVINIDSDHLDHYEDFEEIAALFENWLGLLPKKGSAIVYGDGSAAEKAAKASGCRVFTYGRSEENNLWFSDVTFDDKGSQFTLNDQDSGDSTVVRLKIPGEHNILNALAALAVAKFFGVSFEKAAGSLSLFSGVKRRFQFIAEGYVSVVDDYAHHPTEVEATLKAARNFVSNRLICVFQPHRFSRTKFLSARFGAAFDVADLTVMTDVYNAGEEPIPGVSGKLLVDEILSFKPSSRIAYIPNKSEVTEYLFTHVRTGDIVVTMGAGDISLVGQELAAKLEESG